MADSSNSNSADQYLLHPQAETFGPFDLAFVRQKLAEGAIAPSTGLTIIRGGVEDKWHSVGELWPEPREWRIACAECQLSQTVMVTEAITIFGGFDGDIYRMHHLQEFVQKRCPNFRKIERCSAQYPEGYEIGRRKRV